MPCDAMEVLDAGGVTTHHCLFTQSRRIRRLLVVAVCFCVIYLRTLYQLLVPDEDDSTSTSIIVQHHHPFIRHFSSRAKKQHVPASAVLVRDYTLGGVGKPTSRRQNSTLPEGADVRVLSRPRGAFPRLLYIDDDATMHDTLGRRNKTRDIDVDDRSLKATKRIADDDNYVEISEYSGRDWIRGLVNSAYPSDKTDNCVPMSTWQTMSHPNCNVLHEIDKTRIGELLHLGSGYSNDVFRVTDDGGKYLALKLLSSKERVVEDYATIVSAATVILYNTPRSSFANIYL